MTGHYRGGETEPPEPPPRTHAAQVRETLRALSDPLRSQLGEIEARLVEVEAERDDLKKARAEIVSVLAKFDPSMRPNKAKPKSASASAAAEANRARGIRQDVERVEWLQAYFVEHPDEFEEGFTAHSLAGAVTTKIPRGLSVATAKRAIVELRDRGVVRADRVTRGGGMRYRLTLNGDGAHG